MRAQLSFAHVACLSHLCIGRRGPQCLALTDVANKQPRNVPAYTYPSPKNFNLDDAAVLAGPCPTGRTNVRIKGWMGRADQTTKIRGMFVHPGQVADIARRFPEVIKARLVVSGEMANDHMTLKVETRGAAEGLDSRISEAIRDVTKLRGAVDLLAPGGLPNDGKVIEDARSYR